MLASRLCELREGAALREVVDAAVAEMAEVHPLRREPREAQRSAHAGAFLVGLAQLEKVFVDGGEELRQDVLEAVGHPAGAEAETAREQARDAIDRDAAGELARFRAAHPIADGEDEIGIRQRARPGFTEIADLMAVEVQREEGIFVVRPHPAAIGEARPGDLRGRGRRRRGGNRGGGGAHLAGRLE